jgi:CheY-like chemotaxis protein
MTDLHNAILIVEDNTDLQDILTDMLPYYDLSADIASTAEQGLLLLAQNSYAGVIIDLGLPKMDGFELVRIIRSQPATRDLPCVAITAWHGSEMKQKAMAAGFNAYFAKPFVFETIIRDLKAAIGLS